MEIAKYIVLFLFLFLLSCSSNKDNENLKKLVDLYLNQNNKNEIIEITEEKIKHINYPIIEIRTNGMLSQGVFLPMTTRDSYINWTSGIGQIVTLDGGSITKTYGMDVYLNSLEIENINPFNNKTNLNLWPETIEKTYKYVQPNYEELKISVTCKLTRENREKIYLLEKQYNFLKVKESCYNKSFDFINYYWVNSSGFIWKSKQWISPNGVYANIYVLKK